jgi:hypothetical protein
MSQSFKSRRERPPASFPLPENHGWRSKPGYQIFVANRGEVRFDYPEHWIIDSRPPITLRDHEPPEDRCRLRLLIYRPAPNRKKPAAPIQQVLEDLMDVARAENSDDDPGYPLGRGDVTVVQREDLELAWRQSRFFDPYKERETLSRSCAARASGVLPLLTFDFPADDRSRFDPIWNEILTSLQVGHYIEDPQRYFLH